MSVIEYIILSLALAIPVLVTLRGCALSHRIRLSWGLAASLILAVEHTLLILLGAWVGNMLRFDIPDYDNLIYLGLIVVVALRMFFPAFRKGDKALPAYDISRLATILLLGVATGTNALFVGLGLGFHPHVQLPAHLWRIAVPMLVAVFLFSYWGIMLGRRKKEVRQRRWQLIAVLFLLIFAIKGAFFTE